MVSTLIVTDIEFHDAANIFPLDEEHIAELAIDIQKNGQQLPIELFEGKVLDGRRRYLACQHADIEPKFRDVKPSDPVAYVLSLNIHRRHLSETQRAIAGAKAMEMYSSAAKERQRLSKGQGIKGPVNLPDLKGDARDKVGEVVGVSGKSISHGVKVLSDGTPKLVAAVEADKIAVSTAAKVALMPPDQQDDFVDRAIGKPTARKNQIADKEEVDDQPAGERRGKGVILANEAINCLTRIPRNDALRKRGFQIVMDWIKANK